MSDQLWLGLVTDPELTAKQRGSYLRLNNPELCCLLEGGCDQGLLADLNATLENLVTVNNYRRIDLDGYRIKIYDHQPFIQVARKVSSVQAVVEAGQLCFPGFGRQVPNWWLGCDTYTNELLVTLALKKLSTWSSAILAPMDGTVCTKQAGFWSRLAGRLGLQSTQQPVSLLKAETCSNQSCSLNPACLKADLLHNDRFYSQLRTEDRELLGVYQDQALLSTTKAMKPEVAEGLVLQVLAMLDQLNQGHQFVHGQLTADKVLICPSQATSFKYGDYQWTSHYQVKLTDFELASLTIPTKRGYTRIYPQASKLQQTYLSLFNTKPKVKQGYYRLSGLSTDLTLSQVHYSGLPAYRSFDVYVFLTSLLSSSWFLDLVLGQPRLRALFWEPLWLPAEQDKIYQRLLPFVDGKTASLTDVMTLLKGLTLRCQVVKQIFWRAKNPG